jgi:hypothetical protein
VEEDAAKPPIGKGRRCVEEIFEMFVGLQFFCGYNFLPQDLNPWTLEYTKGGVAVWMLCSGDEGVLLDLSWQWIEAAMHGMA